MTFLEICGRRFYGWRATILFIAIIYLITTAILALGVTVFEVLT